MVASSRGEHRLGGGCPGEARANVPVERLGHVALAPALEFGRGGEKYGRRVGPGDLGGRGARGEGRGREEGNREGTGQGAHGGRYPKPADRVQSAK